MAATDGDISNVELLRQLKAFGEEPGPVTATTRGLLLRKLKKLQNEQSSKETSTRKPSPRRATPARRSLPATRNQSPSRKLIGFSSDEEDAGPSHSSTVVDASKLRRREETTTSNVSQRRERSRQITPTRRNNLRSREPSFIDKSGIAEKTLDSTDGNDGEFSDSDRQIYHRPRGRAVGITDYFRPRARIKRGRAQDESERSETTLSSTSYDNNEHSVTTDSELDPSLQRRHTGANRVKSTFSWSSTVKILLLISAICMALLLYATLKSHSSKQVILANLGKNIVLISPFLV